MVLKVLWSLLDGIAMLAIYRIAMIVLAATEREVDALSGIAPSDSAGTIFTLLTIAFLGAGAHLYFRVMERYRVHDKYRQP